MLGLVFCSLAERCMIHKTTLICLASSSLLCIHLAMAGMCCSIAVVLVACMSLLQEAFWADDARPAADDILQVFECHLSDACCSVAVVLGTCMSAGGILGGSVPDHLLVNYRKSLVAICLAQFNNRKGFAGGNQVTHLSASTFCLQFFSLPPNPSACLTL